MNKNTESLINGVFTAAANFPQPPFCPPPHPPIPEMPKGTINYQLPQWNAQTVTSWMTQLNYAMYRIDEVIHNLALRTAVDGMPEDVITDVENLNKQYEILANKVQELINSDYDTKAQMASVQTQLTNLTTQVTTLTTNMANLDTRVSTAETKQTNMDALIAKIQENLNSLTSTVEEHTTKFADIDTQLADIETRLAALEGGVS